MKLKTKIEVEVDPNSNEHHHYMIQALQILYREHCDDLEMESYYRLEDKEDCKKRLKAIKKLLAYFMITNDFDDFIEAVDKNRIYVFNPERYSDL
jgi:hypothetical protein